MDGNVGHVVRRRVKAHDVGILLQQRKTDADDVADDERLENEFARQIDENAANCAVGRAHGLEIADDADALKHNHQHGRNERERCHNHHQRQDDGNVHVEHF